MATVLFCTMVLMMSSEVSVRGDWRVLFVCFWFFFAWNYCCQKICSFLMLTFSFPLIFPVFWWNLWYSSAFPCLNHTCLRTFLLECSVARNSFNYSTLYFFSVVRNLVFNPLHLRLSNNAFTLFVNFYLFQSISPCFQFHLLHTLKSD